VRKLAWLLAVVGVMVWCAGATSTGTAATPHAAPLFTECPHIGGDSGCQFLITVTDLGRSMASDPSQPSYATDDAATHESGTPTDALIGVRNDSSQPLTQLNISGSITFEFDGDGICDNAGGPAPAGCQTPSGSTACGAFKGGCSFPPPPGEPPNYTESRAPQGTPAFANGDVQNGYEGPTSWFSNVAPSPSSSGTVNFSPALAPGASTYFALEAAPKNFPVTTGVTASQSAAGMTGARLYLPFGSSVLSRGVVSGGKGQLTGSMTFQTFRAAACAGAPAWSSTTPLGAGGVGSAQMLTRHAGVYYWRVQYGGDSTNGASETNCGTSVVVVPPRGTAGLPKAKRCVSAVRAVLRVRRTRARSSLVFANGTRVGSFGGRIRIRLRPHHRRTTVSVIAATGSRAFSHGSTEGLIQQSRRYLSC
jgi:hypothetical protein